MGLPGPPGLKGSRVGNYYILFTIYNLHLLDIFARGQHVNNMFVGKAN